MIKRFKEFNESNESNETLRIFDFDDTLVNSPSFEELAIEFLKEDLSIGDMLKTSVGRIGVNLRDLKWENGYQCSKCKHDKFCKGRTTWYLRCTKCKYDESVKSNTLFHKMKLPILNPDSALEKNRYFNSQISNA